MLPKSPRSKNPASLHHACQSNGAKTQRFEPGVPVCSENRTNESTPLETETMRRDFLSFSNDIATSSQSAPEQSSQSIAERGGAQQALDRLESKLSELGREKDAVTAKLSSFNQKLTATQKESIDDSHGAKHEVERLKYEVDRLRQLLDERTEQRDALVIISHQQEQENQRLTSVINRLISERASLGEHLQELMILLNAEYDEYCAVTDRLQPNK